MISQEIRNYIYYVSDMGTIPAGRHSFKMGKEKEIAGHIARGIKACRIMKSSDYDGGVVEAESIGIIFPVHSWGVSLAVKLFISSLVVKKGTYVYAVAVGESICADMEKDRTKNGALEDFVGLFTKKRLGRRADVYVRCDNIKRVPGGTEETIRYSLDKKKNIESIMKGLLCYNLDSIGEYTVLPKEHSLDDAFANNRAYEKKYTDIVAVAERRQRGISLGNVFLDEDMLAGVRLCRVM